MSNDERDTVFLKEVLDLIDLTIANVPKDKMAFLDDLNVRDATALRIQAIGEHMRSLSEKFRETHPGIAVAPINRHAQYRRSRIWEY